MATYLEWNDAIASFFGDGLPQGETFYLSVDDDALVEIGLSSFEAGPADQLVSDFETAVRNECVRGGRVLLPDCEQRPHVGAPRCIAFLAAMVLAAHRMAPDDEVADNNYFTRLREVLGIRGGQGRPAGLAPNAPEEELWSALNVWVLRRGWRPSAERGPEGPTKFINFPISQSLLREGDKGKLESSFRNSESALGRESDRERVAAWFFNRALDSSTSHIRNLARESTSDRYDDIVDAVYDVYTSMNWTANPAGGGTSGKLSSPRKLMAGLYREFNPIFGSITYCLLPRGAFRGVGGGLSVVGEEGQHALRQERDGRFLPLWPVNPKGGETFAISGDSRLSELHLPSRRFWILTRDRNDSGSGPLASRGTPQLGESFLLLCREECQDQMDILKNEGLIEWRLGPVQVEEWEGWTEFRECMVVSANWDSIIPSMTGLFDELRPRTRASISLHGGLRTRTRDTWLEGHLPVLTVTSFDPTWELRITDLSPLREELVLNETVNANTPVNLAHLSAGDYQVEVLRGSRSADRRLIRVLSWETLESNRPSDPIATDLGEYVLYGALLEPRPIQEGEA